MRYTYLIILLVTITTNQAQNWEWWRNHSGQVDNTYVTCLTASNRNVIAAGSYLGFGQSGSSSYKAFILKYDSVGQLQWHRNYINSTALSCDMDSAGNFYLLGSYYWYTYLDSTLLYAPNGSYFLTKINTQGQVMWAKDLPQTKTNSVKVMGDKVLLTGKFTVSCTFGTENFISNGGSDMFIAQLDTAGNYLWTKQLGGYGNDMGTDCAIDKNGNVFVSGVFASSFTADNFYLASRSKQDAFVTKLDKNGEFQWFAQVRGANDETIDALAIDNFGNTYCTGSYTSGVTLDTIVLTSQYSMQFICRVDSSGHFSNAFNAPNILDIAIDANGDVLTTSRPIILAKYSPAGTLIWSVPGDGTESVCLTVTDQDVYVGGDFQTAKFGGDSSVTSSNGTDAFVARMSDDQSLSVNQFQAEKHSLTLWPNPSNGLFTIREMNKFTRIELFDVLGQKVEHSIQEGKIKIEGDYSGPLIFQIENKGSYYRTQAMVIPSH